MQDIWNNVVDKCKNTRILAIIGLALLFLGNILPYFEVKILWVSESFNLFSTWEGKLIMLLVFVNIFFIFKDLIEQYIPKLFETSFGKRMNELYKPKYLLVPSILIAILVAIVTFETISSVNDLNKIAGGSMNFFQCLSMGFYITLLGTVAIIIFAVLHRNDSTEMATTTPDVSNDQQM